MKIKEKPAGKKMKKINITSIKMKKHKKSTDTNLLKKQSKLKNQKSLKSVAHMSVEDFMSGGYEDIDENSVSSVGSEDTEPKISRKKKKIKYEGSNGFDEGGNEGDDSEVDEPIKKKRSHKEELETLKEVDPEFYKFLEENDRDLLDFRDISDDEESGEEDNVHRPPDELEVASDESDFEPDESVRKTNDWNVTLKKVENWREQLQEDRTNKTLREVLEAFQAALQCVVPENERVPCKYQVEGAAVFNAVLRLCVMELQPSLRRILKLPPGSKLCPTKTKNWPKIRVLLRTYLLDLTRLCQVTSPGMLSVLLKHVHQMAPYAVCFPNIASKLLSRLVGLWTSEADVVRVLAFLCLLRIANLKRPLLNHILKKMYIAFVRNSKFVSPNNLPGVNFLRQSLSEMFALDPSLSYQHAFLYIRQLSIHLRNAVTLNKKESYQAVYNWQYVQSLQLWAELLGLVRQDSPLSSLIYPLVQITLGTIKLIPSPQYFPLRFHCCKFLLSLMEKCGVFIPVLPLLLEVLKDYDFNKKHSKVSMKPMDLSCILRCSKLQMQENGFKDIVIETVCALLLETFNAEAYRLSFPDMVVPAVIQMKAFLKTCKVSKYCKQVKAILDKVLENSKVIESERNKASIRLDDTQGIAALETALKNKKLPLMTYYESWHKLHLQQQAKKITDNESIGNYKLPTLYKFDKKKSREREGPVELFPSDDDDSDGDVLFDKDEVEASKPQDKRKRREEKQLKKKKKIQSKLNVSSGSEFKIPTDWPELDPGDIVEDFNVSDLE